MKRVKLEVELANGETHNITIPNVSLVAWDRTRVVREWPPVDDAPMLWMTFISWHHLKAQGLVDCTYEQYEAELCVGVGDPDEGKEADEREDVDPTQPGPDPAYSSS